MMEPPKVIKTSDVLCEFFEVAVHNILYIRKLYPNPIFERRRKYGVIVYQCIVPLVSDYISDCLRAVEFHAKAHTLRKLVVGIVVAGTVIERYVFDILKFDQDLKDVNFMVKLEQSLRALCLKLHANSKYLKPLPEDATFCIHLHTTQGSSIDFNAKPEFENFPWIPINGEKVEIPYADIVPLYDVESDYLKFQMYIERCCKD